ncbi:bifunctional demethylmenaquinone methyltransferase/2-methoxy-6-polyprenyl-1,4-benzoquinol methylase UbiE [bacterium]|nr:bifunctional demethylmenaquinone methyltransferase/2-methoxy-6-polyprenyl-1,4-benzoquinol methylase UbiE [bacterium]
MPSKDPARIQSMFGRIAPTYDLLNHALSMNIDQAWRRYTTRKALRASDRRVLDLACGTGDLAITLRKHADPEAEVIGADFCMPMLKIADRKAPLSFVQADGLCLPFADASFDLVTIAFGLRNMADPKAGIREMGRVIRPGGRLAILEFTTPQNAVFKGLYLAYFKHILPFAGNLVSGSRAYRYLTDSVLEWPGRPELARWIRAEGFSRVRHRQLTFGIAALHIAEKEKA